jgi:hypothetical protein
MDIIIVAACVFGLQEMELSLMVNQSITIFTIFVVLEEFTSGRAFFDYYRLNCTPAIELTEKLLMGTIEYQSVVLGTQYVCRE